MPKIWRSDFGDCAGKQSVREIDDGFITGRLWFEAKYVLQISQRI